MDIYKIMEGIFRFEKPRFKVKLVVKRFTCKERID